MNCKHLASTCPMWVETTRRGASTASSSTSPGERKLHAANSSFYTQKYASFASRSSSSHNTQKSLKKKKKVCVICMIGTMGNKNLLLFGVELCNLFLTRGSAGVHPHLCCLINLQFQSENPNDRAPTSSCTQNCLISCQVPHKERHVAGKEWQVMWQLLVLWKHTVE